MQFRDVEHEGVVMKFATPNQYTNWRVETIRTKEPCTLEWIAGFRPGGVLIDCGANVGMYSIWAAATRRVHVRAFEPEAQNYMLLNANIFQNKLAHLIAAYPLALSNVTELSTLYMSDMRAGGSCHAVGEALDYKHEKLAHVFEQGCMTTTLDELFFVSGATGIPCFNYVKIDVDGFEPKVIEGARKSLTWGCVASLLIEVNQNLDDHMHMVRELGDMGFVYDPAQVKKAERTSGPFQGVAEYVFNRC
jgi:FkbM family methyltransferase